MSLLKLILDLIVTLFKVSRPGGAKALMAENVALRQQLVVLSRKLNKSPPMKPSERFVLGLLLFWIKPSRLNKVAIIIKPATLLQFHRHLVKRKYRLLYSNKSKKKPGPKGPDEKIIKAVLEMKQRNPTFGYLRISMQINSAFGANINQYTVRRILKKHYKPLPGGHGPSWLTFLGHTKDSLWSVDLFRCESILLKTHWVMLVIDQYSRQIIGMAVHNGDVNGVILCRFFNKIISTKEPPNYLSSDHDPLFRYHQWQANLRILDVYEIKTVPEVPISHPFVERLIRTIRNELLDQTLFWNSVDLSRKLSNFMTYYNQQRCHLGINSDIPEKKAANEPSYSINIENYRWRKHCGGLFELPIAC